MTKRVPARAKAEAYQLPTDARIAVSRIGKEIQVVDPLAIFRSGPSKDSLAPSPAIPLGSKAQEEV